MLSTAAVKAHANGRTVLVHWAEQLLPINTNNEFLYSLLETVVSLPHDKKWALEALEECFDSALKLMERPAMLEMRTIVSSR